MLYAELIQQRVHAILQPRGQAHDEDSEAVHLSPFAYGPHGHIGLRQVAKSCPPSSTTATCENLLCWSTPMCTIAAASS